RVDVFQLREPQPAAIVGTDFRVTPRVVKQTQVVNKNVATLGRIGVGSTSNGRARPRGAHLSPPIVIPVPTEMDGTHQVVVGPHVRRHPARHQKRPRLEPYFVRPVEPTGTDKGLPFAKVATIGRRMTK